jgi:hypothetical protein
MSNFHPFPQLYFMPIILMRYVKNILKPSAVIQMSPKISELSTCR